MSQRHDGGSGHEPPSFWKTRYGIGLLVFGGVAGYFLLTEHLAHLAGALPYLLLLSCPLMHIFMHHRHSDHHHGPDGGADCSSSGGRGNRDQTNQSGKGPQGGW